jgi:hypothetical protein
MPQGKNPRPGQGPQAPGGGSNKDNGMTGAERRIARRKRAEFADRQQYNRIVGQLNREYAGIRSANPTMTAEQIFAAQRGAAALGTTPGGGTSFVPGDVINGPTDRSGITGQGGTPKTGGVGNPAWMANPFANLTGTSGISGQGLGTRPARNPSETGGGGRPLYRPAQDDGNPFSGVTGTTGTTPSNVPAWLSGVVNRQNIATGLAGLGLASNAMPLFAGTLAPAFSALAQAVNPQRRPVNTPAGPLTSSTAGRTVDPMTGIPDFQMLTETGPQFNFGGGGGSWYGQYRRRGRGGGGGFKRFPPRGSGYGYGDGEGGGYNNGPAWGPGLANWSIG